MPDGTASDARAERLTFALAGTRLGLWGAAQAIGFAVGGLFGAAASDAARAVLGSAAAGYGAVFAAEAVMFLVAAALAAHPSQRVLRTPRIAAPGAATAATR
jgi:BCD family chlorophyll transporter-like MFS transporter